MFSSWLGKWAPKNSRQTRGNRRPAQQRAVLNIEQLEDRVVPATFLVNIDQDTVVTNLSTGQDINGNISLRSAIMAANAQGAIRPSSSSRVSAHSSSVSTQTQRPAPTPTPAATSIFAVT